MDCNAFKLTILLCPNSKIYIFYKLLTNRKGLTD